MQEPNRTTLTKDMIRVSSSIRFFIKPGFFENLGIIPTTQHII